MATLVVECAPSKEKTTFSDSSEEDIAYAKTFWQSVQLLPPLESRLVSSDIKQRLKIAPPGSQPVVLTYPDKAEPKKLTEFLVRAQELERAEKQAKLDHLSRKREEDLILLHKHRAERVNKERISTGFGVKSPEPQPLPIRDNDLDEEFDEDPETISKEIELFEQSKNIITHDSDSD